MMGSSWSASIGSISRSVRPMCCSIDAPFSCREPVVDRRVAQLGVECGEPDRRGAPEPDQQPVTRLVDHPGSRYGRRVRSGKVQGAIAP